MAAPLRTYTFTDPDDQGKPIPFPTLADEPTLDLSVIIPAYNEEARLPSMLSETLTYLQNRSKRSSFTYELIIVDDGSHDSTPSIVMAHSRQHSTDRVRLLRQIPNAGKGAAVRAGMISARGRTTLMADADAATVFSDLENLEDALAMGADVAVGSRTHLKNSSSTSQVDRSPLRAFVSMVFHLLVVLVAGVSGIGDTQCGFKLYNRRATRVAFEDQHLERWAFDIENLYRVQRAGLRVVEVGVRWTEVPGSKLSVVKATINMAFDMLRMRFHYMTGRWKLPAATMSM